MKKQMTAVLLALLLALSAAGCGTPQAASSASPESAASEEGTASSEAEAGEAPGQNAKPAQNLFLCLGAEPGTLDPAKSAGCDTDAYTALAFEGLYRLDRKGKPVPGQAQQVSVSADGLTWTFTLRDDALWSDGEQVKAGDFVYAWRRAATLSDAVGRELFCWLQGGAELTSGTTRDAGVLGAEAVSDRVLRVTLSAPCEDLPRILTQPIFMPLREDVVGKDENWGRNVFLCNGPMRIAAWNHKESIYFQKNPRYYEQDADMAASVTFSLLEDDDAKLSAYETGELDYIDSLPMSALSYLKERGDYTVRNELSTACLFFGTTTKPLNNEKVRRALSLAVDRDALCENTLGKEFQKADALVPPELQSWLYEAGKYLSGTAAENAAQAKALLAEAGYADGKGFPELTITVRYSTRDLAVASAVAEMWRETLGISCKVEQLPCQTWLQRRQEGSVQVTIGDLSASYGSPLSVLETLLPQGSANTAGWKDDRYTALLQTARTASGEERDAALREAEALLWEQLPAAPLFWERTLMLRRPALVGGSSDAFGNTSFLYGRILKTP